MRVKVECVPPLPSTKIWFIVPHVSTISDLKDTLCSELPALGDEQTNARDIILFLDGFELLDATLIDVVRDGDLITYAHSSPYSSTSTKTLTVVALGSHRVKPNVTNPGKRKAADEDYDVPRKKPRQATTTATTVANASRSTKTLPPTETSSESSSSSDSDDDSEESSASDSESDSSSSSSSSASSAPSVRPSTASAKRTTGLLQDTSKAKVGIPNGQAPNGKSPAKNLVPPGQGKTSTHNRNLRRRKKKQFERQASQTEPANPNDIPLGQKSSLQEASLINEAATSSAQVPANKPAHPTFMMASLSNKNKRKGFKQATASTLPKKIIFADSGEPEGPEPQIQDELPFSGEPPADISKTAPNLFPRLIPPSELQDQGKLPPNMFVTSIDVEEGMHPPRRKNKKKRTESYMSEVQEVEQVVLDYGYADDVIPSQREEIEPLVDGSGATEQDWSVVEAKWDSLPKLINVSQVQSGKMLGWKALAINPATFTPEFLLNIGKVTKVDPKQLTVQPLHRPGAAEISFGGFVDEEDGEVQLEEETFEWNDVLAGEWRIIS
ncbi:hypothetical protein EIP86_001732 [Pleurotus ostreatoroseus]|nr:hypothetical protein EIP86_001732 [Pleurotus ostreatoroseus]